MTQNPASEPLRKPLTTEEMRARLDNDGFVTALVPVEVDFLLDRDFEALMDFFSFAVTGGIAFQDISYKAASVNTDRQEVIFEVSGNVEDLLSLEQ